MAERPATPLEAYITGLIHTSLTVPPLLPQDLHLAPQTTEDGQVTGAIEVHTRDGRVRASILVTETEA